MTIHQHIDLEVPAFGEFGSSPIDRAGYAQTVMDQSPIGYWRLGETSGSVASDASGHERHGQYQGGIALAQGGALTFDADPAAEFDGQDGRVQTGLAASSVGDQLSISCWFMLDEPTPAPGTGHRERLVTFLRIARGTRIALGLEDDRLIAAWHSGSSFSRAYTAEVLAPDRWYHAALTYDGETIRVFLDGQLALQVVTPISTLTYSWALIGSHDPTASTPRYFSGRIDEVAVFDVALSADQLVTQFQRGSHG